MPFNSKTASNAGKKSKRGRSKTTIELQNSFNIILSNNLENLESWLNEVAKKEPAKALDLILKMSSFVMPKMRTIQSEDTSKQCNCEDLSKLTDEELNEQLRQAHRVLYPEINLAPISFIKTPEN